MFLLRIMYPECLVFRVFQMRGCTKPSGCRFVVLAYFPFYRRHGVRNRSISDTETLQPHQSEVR